MRGSASYTFEIKRTQLTEHHPIRGGAYSDNAAVIEGRVGRRFLAEPESGRYGYVDDLTHILMKVETPNHPTAISPFAGAATGSGGEIRDEGATGRQEGSPPPPAAPRSGSAPP